MIDGHESDDHDSGVTRTWQPNLLGGCGAEFCLSSSLSSDLLPLPLRFGLINGAIYLAGLTNEFVSLCVGR